MKFNYLLTLVTLLNTLMSCSIASDCTIECLANDEFNITYKNNTSTVTEYINDILNLPSTIRNITQKNIEFTSAYYDTYNSALWLNDFAMNNNIQSLKFINNNSNFNNIVINCATDKENLKQQTIYCNNLDSIAINSEMNTITMPKINQIISNKKMKLFINDLEPTQPNKYLKVIKSSKKK